MQTERFKDAGTSKFFDKIIHDTFFEEPVEFNEEKLKEDLADPGVAEVHVFKATPNNMKFANLRKRFPNMTRRQLRRFMKRKLHKENK